MPRKRQPAGPFRYFNSSPEVIRLVMMYVKYPLSLRNVEDLLFERGIDICHETVRMWWNRFGPLPLAHGQPPQIAVAAHYATFHRRSARASSAGLVFKCPRNPDLRASGHLGCFSRRKRGRSPLIASSQTWS